jgi:hypothetical protein
MRIKETAFLSTFKVALVLMHFAFTSFKSRDLISYNSTSLD